ncbi:MAG: DUF6094 domain-containing protein [Candidatus Rokuibacteriota bacterium]
MAPQCSALARPAAIPAGAGLRLRQLLSLPDAPFAALAASCGDGQLLASLTAGSTAIRYGIEPHRPPANQAATRLSRVLICDLEDARVAHDEVSLLVLGPATRSARSGRVPRRRDVGDVACLRAVLPWLRPGGILLLLLAADELQPSAIKLLSARYDAVTAYRLSSSATSTLAIVGVKKPSAHFDPAVRDALAEARAGRAAILPARPSAAYTVPTGHRLSIFRSVILDPEVLENEVRRSSVWSAFWQAQVAGRGRPPARPPLPLHKGHLGLLLAAGECDGILGQGRGRHLVRGIVRKRDIVLTDNDGGQQTTRTRDVFRVVVKLLFPDGTLRVIGDQAPSVSMEPDAGDAVEGLNTALGGSITLDPPEEDVELNALTGRRRRSFDV